MKGGREQKRNELAENVCRELRYQISSASNWDGARQCHHLNKWMKVAKKNKYTRPE